MSRAEALLVAAASVFLVAAAPVPWRHPEGRGQDEGEENISLAENGWILLAPASREILPGEAKTGSPPLLWAATVDIKGSLYVGGAGARVLRIEKKGKAEPFFDSEALGVRALVSDVAGNLYVATFPNGRVYRVGAEGSTEVYFEPEERYLWAMAVDAFDRLYVASGERGIVYQVTGRGEGRAFFDSDEPHITSLASDPSGRLLAGSSGRGLLYRLDLEGRPEVILDSSLEEISAVTVASDGTVFAAAISGPGPPRMRRPGDRADEYTIEVTPAGGDDLLEEAAEQKRKLVLDLGELLPAVAEGGTAPPASVVYRVTPGRTPEVLWSSPVERVYSLTLDAGGHLLMGTGPSGRVYRVEPDASVTLLRRYPASQITALVAGGEGKTYVLTSNPGRAHTLDTAPSGSGRYFSPVHDAKVVSSWGSLLWNGDLPPGTKVEIVARSGNSPVPDETWSAWSDPCREPRGSALTLPAARYVQWRADLSRLKTEATPILKNVTLTYLPENLPPAVRRVAVSEPGAPRPEVPAAVPTEKAGKDRPAEPKETPARIPNSLWLTWTSSDANGDPLEHTVSVRRSEETEWRVLARGVKEPPFEIDPSALPGGRYAARVEADDAEANGADRGLSGEGRSDLFEIDRTPPVIEPSLPEEAEGMIRVTFLVRDASSCVARAEWAAEPDGPWTSVPPRDGIADTPVETFQARVPAGAAQRRIFLRAGDAAGNSATVEVTLSRSR